MSDPFEERRYDFDYRDDFMDDIERNLEVVDISIERDRCAGCEEDLL